MSTIVTTDSTLKDTPERPTGWRRYLYSTNHKDIGTMFLVFAIGAGLIGVCDGSLRARQALGVIAALLDQPEAAVVETATPVLRALVSDGLLI